MMILYYRSRNLILKYGLCHCFVDPEYRIKGQVMSPEARKCNNKWILPIYTVNQILIHPTKTQNQKTPKPQKRTKLVFQPLYIAEVL